MNPTFPSVVGYCPMGCGRTLFLGKGGHVTCSYEKCPDPSRLDKILNDNITDHTARLDEHGFSILHPIRERTEGQILDCTLHQYLTSLSGPPRVPGQYVVAEVDGEWVFL